MRDGIFKYKIRMPTILRLVGICYHDSRNFGTIKLLIARQELAEVTVAGTRLSGGEHHRTRFCQHWPLKESRNETFLMDQSKLAGVGNCYLSEEAL
jgi:formamidopyrimidine-DNA glycosylase